MMRTDFKAKLTCAVCVFLISTLYVIFVLKNIYRIHRFCSLKIRQKRINSSTMESMSGMVQVSLKEELSLSDKTHYYG